MLVRQNIFSVKLAHIKVILKGISFLSPITSHFIDIADKFDSIFINGFADNAVFIGRLSQTLQAADVCYTRIREIDLQWNPQEPIIYIPNKDPTYSAPCDHLP